jgi:hypothetical protein
MVVCGWVAIFGCFISVCEIGVVRAIRIRNIVSIIMLGLNTRLDAREVMYENNTSMPPKYTRNKI